MLFNAVQRYVYSPGTGTLHWQSLFSTAIATSDRFFDLPNSLHRQPGKQQQHCRLWQWVVIPKIAIDCRALLLLFEGNWNFALTVPNPIAVRTVKDRL
jgi:hypothetical protein